MTEDELVELAELRRRAYGPDADIDGDARARARLAELEAVARAEHPAPPLVLSAGEPAGAHPPARSADSPAPAQDADIVDGTSADVRERGTGPRGRSLRIVAAAVAAAVVVGAVAVLWPRSSPAPVAYPSQSITFGAVDPTCGSGWGPRAAGILHPPRRTDVVWSSAWNEASAVEPTLLIAGRQQWFGRLTPVYVPGGVASVVQVIDSQDARIVTFARSQSNGDSFTTSDYANTDAMVAAARRIVPLPACSDPDTYPLLVIAPNERCVQLEVTLAEGAVYRATVAVGSDTCAAKQ